MEKKQVKESIDREIESFQSLVKECKILVVSVNKPLKPIIKKMYIDQLINNMHPLYRHIMLNKLRNSEEQIQKLNKKLQDLKN